jgi:hypothetical protein
MPKDTEPTNSDHSPVAILTELLVEGTSTFIETQRIFLDLIQKENDLLMNGVKERVGASTPMVAMTDLARRSVDTLVDMDQEFLTTVSKQTLRWLEAVQSGKGYRSSEVVDAAREAMEHFFHARQQFLDALAEETSHATSGKSGKGTTAQRTEPSKLAREAVTLFIEAQKKVLDVLAQQMNVNLNAATQAVETLSAPRLAPFAEIPVKAVRTLFDKERALLDSVTGTRRGPKPRATRKPPRNRNVRRRIA